MSQTKIRLSTVEDIVASVPSLIGFRPADGDLVVICLRGNRVGVTMRITLPEDQDDWEGVAAALAAAYRQDEASRALVVLYGGNALTLTVVTALLDAQRMDVREAVRVEGDLVTCASGCSHSLPSAPTAVDAAYVAMGRVTAASRDEVVERIAFRGPGAPNWTDRLLESGVGLLGTVTGNRDAYLARVARLDHDALLVEVEVLCEIARHTPPWGPYRDVVLTVLAAAAYLAGDGGLANIALDQLGTSPQLATLLRQCLSVAMPPEMVRGALVNA